MIYDSVLTEGSSEELLVKHGLITKPFPRWQDNLFMCLRKDSVRTESQLYKIPGKKMCIPSACYNIGGSKVQKAVKALQRNGPYSFKSIQQWFVLRKTGQYLKPSDILKIEASAPGTGFCLYAQGHTAGLRKEDENTLSLADPSYPNVVRMPVQVFKACITDFQNRHASVPVVVFELVTEHFSPGPMAPCFNLTAAGKVAKRPARARPPVHSQAQPKKFCTPVTQCKCGAQLEPRSDGCGVQDALLVSFRGVEKIQHEAKRCSSRSCRMTFHYNFCWVGGRKMNTVVLSDVDVLFATSVLAFEKTYLAYNESCQFRGVLSARAIEWASFKELFLGPEREGLRTRLDREYNTAKMLYLYMKEFEAMDMGLNAGPHLTKEIDVGADISEGMLQRYDDWLHTHQFPPNRKNKVKEFVMDGNMKVLMRLCGSAPAPKRACPAKKGAQGNKHFTNGWFMVVDPASARVISVKPMCGPENNQVAFETVERVADMYPNADTLVYDRCCKVTKAGKNRPKLRRIKTWATTMLHGKKHAASCPCNPYSHASIRKRLTGVKDREIRT